MLMNLEWVKEGYTTNNFTNMGPKFSERFWETIEP
jgi:hypothetical protein